ncbi:carbohydrate ABC transporter permease [Alkalibacterium sp. f15]|uniref:carbohydrate ABC transporter permease n=1 Tax=Alkalibacterium sp. f15 TaxID=3414029 RepID=UPI003BF7FF6E
MKNDKDGRIFDLFNIVILFAFSVIIIIPLWNVVVGSFSSGNSLSRGNFIFWPNEWSLQNYRQVLNDDSIVNAFFISISKTFIGVVTHVIFCAVMAYAMSKSYLKGRKLYSTMGIMTMFFSGGMIPTYLLIRNLGLINSYWVYIIPMLLSYYDVIILMNFFRGVPRSLEESAMIDGAGHWRIFVQLYLPLSKPALATIALFNGLFQWNDFMTANLYIRDRALYPLQMMLYEVIVRSQTQGMQEIGTTVTQSTTRGLQLATIVVTTIPVLLIYPWLQKYFMGGMMVGAIKE